jgi:hypothetical protein
MSTNHTSHGSDGPYAHPDNDLAWAQPYIAKAEASLARGEGIRGDRFLAALDRKIAAMKSPTP